MDYINVFVDCNTEELDSERILAEIEAYLDLLDQGLTIEATPADF